MNADGLLDKNILMDVAEKHAGYTHIALRVKNLLQVKSDLENLKIPITEGPIIFEGGLGLSLFIRDQDKNVIEFHQAVK